MSSLRILVVDDSALFRTLLRNVLSEIPHCTVVGTASDGRTAIDRIVELQPDLVTLDVEMPDLNGIDVLRELKQRRIRIPVIMVSRLTSAGARVTTDALIEGAFDFVLKPSGGSPAENKTVLRNALQEKIQAIREAKESRPSPALAATAAAADGPAGQVAAGCEAVVIGCSTGGPDALARVIPDLPGDFPVPVFVVQHMPEGFTASLAARLNESSQLEVLEAADGMRVRTGQVVIARGGRHLQLSRRLPDSILVNLNDAPPEHNCRPAIDHTLRTAVEILQGRLLAVILTGMGRDGTLGCQLVRTRGGQVLAQHADGCTVFGMPKSVISAGLADEVVALPRMSAAITRRTRSSRSNAALP